MVALYSAVIRAMILPWHFSALVSAMLFLGLAVYFAVAAGIGRGFGSAQPGARSGVAQAEALRVLEGLKSEERNAHSERGDGLGCFRGVLWSVGLETVMVLCVVLCWMLIRHW
jgi:hypothetical protein